jgi:hypothetical protein
MNRITPRQYVIGAVVWLLVIGGALTRGADDTAPSTAPVCGIVQTGMFNPCAHLDTTQVQDRRQESADWTADTASDWPVWGDGVPVCTEEDGSAPGQPFPCRWESGANGTGGTYTLDGPM